MRHAFLSEKQLSEQTIFSCFLVLQFELLHVKNLYIDAFRFPKMSKKQQTLLQSWSSNKPGAQKPTVPQNVSLLDSDEDDELMRQALEDSLRDYQLKQNLTSPALSSSSGYSTEAPSGVLAENLPGFDSEAGKTWIYPTNKPVRKYQRDIVETCIFQNTLVTLPTGLGMIFFLFSFQS